MGGGSGWSWSSLRWCWLLWVVALWGWALLPGWPGRWRRSRLWPQVRLLVMSMLREASALPLKSAAAKC